MESRLINSRPYGFREYFIRLWKYRSMIMLLAGRNIKIQYSQTLFGTLWVFLQPLVAVFIYSVFFYKILGISTDPVPYPVFVIPGILLWFHFSSIVSDVGGSLQEQQDLIRKVDFPRLIILLAKVISGLLSVFVTVVLFFAILFIFDHPLTSQVLFFPLFLLLNILMGLSIAIWLAALTIRYRDLHHFVPYLVSFGIWVTPVFYPTTVLPEDLTGLIYFNPLAGILAGYRWSLLDYQQVPLQAFMGIAVMLPVLLLGIRYFIRTEHEIADYV